MRDWLTDVANFRIHATLKERPIDRFATERDALRALPLPHASQKFTTKEPPQIIVPMPIESFQHPLSVYELAAKEIAL